MTVEGRQVTVKRRATRAFCSGLRRLLGGGGTPHGREASDRVRVLLRGFGFDAGGDVNAPGSHPADRLGDVVGPQAAGNQDLVLRDEVADDAPAEGDATAGDGGIDEDDVGGVARRWSGPTGSRPSPP